MGRATWSLLKGPDALSGDFRLMKEVSTDAAPWAPRAQMAARQRSQDRTGSEQGGGCGCGSRHGLKAAPGALADKRVGSVKEQDSRDVWPEPHVLQKIVQLRRSFWGS